MKELKLFCSKCKEELWLEDNDTNFYCQNKTCKLVGQKQKGKSE